MRSEEENAEEPAGYVQLTVDTPYPVGPVHLYTFELNGSLVLFDTGPPTDEAIAFHRAKTDLDRLEYVILTHCHPDHYGLSDFFVKEANARIIVSRYDAFKLIRGKEDVEHMINIMLDQGAPKSVVEKARMMIEWFQTLSGFAKEFTILEDSDDLLESLGVKYIRCPGHSQSDIVYLVNGCAVTGDVVLRDIFQTPLLDADCDRPGERFDNYGAYCKTIGKLKSIENMKILPGHRIDIDSVDQRIVFYVSKLIERAKTTAPHFHSGKNVFETMNTLFDGFGSDLFAQYIKMSETAFIFDFLKDPDKLAASLKTVGLFEKVEEAYKDL